MPETNTGTEAALAPLQQVFADARNQFKVCVDGKREWSEDQALRWTAAWTSPPGAAE